MSSLAALRQKACISKWFPQIEAAGLPIPKTIIIETGCELIRLCDGECPQGYEEFRAQLAKAVEQVGSPAFLRTGMTSAKHYWNKTCYLPDTNDLDRHISEIVDFSLCADIFGLDISVWAVRELLPTEPAFHAFSGKMPITKERRYFVEGSEVLCAHPYWPEEAFVSRYERDHADVKNWRELLAKLNEDSEEDRRQLQLLTQRAGAAVEGAWSIDWLWTKRGWYLTDMAPAETSYHWEGCPTADRWK